MGTKKTNKKQGHQAPEKRLISGDQALAKHYDTTTRTVYQWRQDGMPATERDRGWEYDLDLTDEWIAARRTDDRDGLISAELNHEIKRAKLRIEQAEADRLEREEQEARGNILPLDDYHLFATEVIQEARDSLLRIPRLMKPHLCRKCQTKAAELETLITKALEQLGKLHDGPHD